VPRLPHLVVALAAVLGASPAAGAQDDPADCYRDAAGRILGRALVDEGAWEKLEHLTTRIGHRLSGSPGLEGAIAWAHEGMKAEGLDGVRLQPVKVPRWVRRSSASCPSSGSA
jgi:carboxypeptidase Q